MSENTPGEFYRIRNQYTGLFLVPRTPEETVSPLCEDDPLAGRYPEEAFEWGFIQLGNDLYRIFNRMTLLCIEAKDGDNPPHKDESVHQNTCVPEAAYQKWYYRNARFECALDPRFVWEPLNQSKAPQTEIILNSVDGSAGQLWTRIAVVDQAAEMGAAAGS